MLWAIPSVFALRQIKKSDKTDVISFHDLIHKKYTFTLYDITRYLSLIKAIDSVGDPPLPIPNREVKPNSADGTAKICGRVGHRHFFSRKLWTKVQGFFFLLSQLARVILVIHYIADIMCIAIIIPRSCSRSLQNTQASLVFHSLTRNIVGE